MSQINRVGGQLAPLPRRPGEPERAAEERIIAPVRARLPDWAMRALPSEMHQEGGGVWATTNRDFNVDALIRENEAGVRRTGAGADARTHFQHLLGEALKSGALDLPAEPLLLDLRSGDGVCSALPWLSLLSDAHVIATDTAS